MSADDNTLMKRVKEGDALAFECLMKRHRRGVLRFLVMFSGNQDTAADLTQETFIRVFFRADRYTEMGNFKTWLYRIARNLAISQFRHQSIRKVLWRGKDDEEGFNLDDLPSTKAEWMPERATANREIMRELNKALKRLTPKLREVFLLCDVSGMSLKEIAETTGIPSATLKVRLFRARSALRQALEPHVSARGGVRTPMAGQDEGVRPVPAKVDSNGGG